MKQGRASSSGMGSMKVEPKSKAVSPGAVAQIGVHEALIVPQPMHQGRGYSAPKSGSQVHRSGSQGKH